jgi:histidinol-phosphate aminotransferase
MFDLKAIVRKNILDLKPYSSARDEYSGAEAVFLDANENPFNTPYNRYPDPAQRRVKELVSVIKNVPVPQIFLGNGSDEAIDLLMRAFCEPGKSNIISIDPSYGMYKVCANINDVQFIPVKLNTDFSLNSDEILNAVNENTRMIFLCSPNNPTANSFDEEKIIKILENFSGLVVIDEAYIDFSEKRGFLPHLSKFENLVVLQTFSKAWGLAGIRLGMAFASEAITGIMNKIKYPYNINILTQNIAQKMLLNVEQKEKWVGLILRERNKLTEQISQLDFVKHIFPSDANFILIKVYEPRKVYDYLVDQQVIVRDRSRVTLCEGCLRITVGSPDENKLFVGAMKQYQENKD